MNTVLSPVALLPEIKDEYAGRLKIICPAPGAAFRPEELKGLLPEAEAYLGGALTAEMIDAAPRLRIACSFGAGYDGIDCEHAGGRGVWIINSPHATTEPTAELTFALILCAARKIFKYNRLLLDKGRCGVPTFPTLDEGGIPLYGKTLGIVGLGKIGKAVARRAAAFGMRILYFDINRLPAETEKELRVNFAPFEQLLQNSDCVTLHCSYSPALHHMMGAKQFALMKPGAYFINAGRGKLTDEEALVSALKSKTIAGAALDVYEYEPEVTSELLALDNAALTPHIGTATRESRLAMAREALDAISGFFAGTMPDTVVNGEFMEKQEK